MKSHYKVRQESLYMSHYKGHYLGAAIRTHYLEVTVKEPLLLRKRSFSVTQGHLGLSDFFQYNQKKCLFEKL